MRYALFTNYAYHDQMSLIEQYSHVLFTPLTLQLFKVEGFFYPLTTTIKLFKSIAISKDGLIQSIYMVQKRKYDNE